MEYKGTVLLVEDNAELNHNNFRALKLLGYDVHSALTLSAARFYLHSAEPDIILLDVMLPDGEGIDFCAEIRGATEAHILFLTAKTAHEDRVRGLAAGGDDYIIKPFHPDELFARVDAAMRRRAMSQRIKKRGATIEEAEAKKLFAFVAHYDLTEKESEVLPRILRKLSIKDMAESMGISVKGIEFHITNILNKTGLGRRRDLRQVYANWKQEMVSVQKKTPKSLVFP